MSPSETDLLECPVCGALGLTERIVDHDCRAFLESRHRRPRSL
ncbi:hypothetical protein [Natronorarus salvus]